MFALVVKRKGDIQEVAVATTEAKAKAEGDRLDGTPLQWQSFYGDWGAHSNHDEEKGYEIFRMRSIP